MWEDILTKDTVLDLISKFIFIETKESKDELTGKTKKSENVIFPRYHQFDVIRKLLGDVRDNGTTQNYLIQHSAGSGKTTSIAWLAHRLTSLHDAYNKIIFDNVVIITDRVVVDRQLQNASLGMVHKAGLIRVMDDKCISADLAINIPSHAFDFLQIPQMDQYKATELLSGKEENISLLPYKATNVAVEGYGGKILKIKL